MAKINRTGYTGPVVSPNATVVFDNESCAFVSARPPTALQAAQPMSSPWKETEEAVSNVEGMLPPTEGGFLCRPAQSTFGKGVILDIGSFMV